MNLLRERARVLGHHRPCMGGDSESSSDQVTTMEDRRATSGNGGASVGGDGNTVSISSYSTDQGAVSGSLSLAKGVSALAFAAADQYAINTRSVFDRAADSVDASSVALKDGYGQALAETRKTFGDALGGLEKAYYTAKAGDQRVVSMVGLAVIGLAAVAFIGPAIFSRK